MDRICFFRHGLAVERGEGVADDGRPLTDEGRSRTKKAALGVRRLDLGIEAIVTSPLPRAAETARILGRALKLKETTHDALRPGGSPLAAIDGLTSSCAALVGHEPDLSEAIEELTGAHVDLKKAGLAVVEGRRLVLLLTPRALRRLAGSP